MNDETDNTHEAWPEAADSPKVLADAARDYARFTRYDQLIADLIKNERTARGWTAEEAAEKAGIAYKTYLRVENGRSVRNLTWKQIDDLFQLPTGTLLAHRSNATNPIAVKEQLRSTRHMVLPPRIYGSERAEASTGTTSMQTAQISYVPRPDLLDRLRDLNLDDLRRLRDMIEGAIAREESLALSSDALNEATKAWIRAGQAYRSSVEAYDKARQERISIERESTSKDELEEAWKVEKQAFNLMINSTHDKNKATAYYQHMRNRETR